MPALRNQRHEAFAQLIVRGHKHGWTQGEAYQRAGYSTTKGAADVAASRLLKNVKLQARIAEIAAPAFRKAQITVETLLAELEANIIGASASRNHAAVNGSVALMAKLRGLLSERVEIGPPGSFDAADTVETVVTRMLAASASTDELLDLLDEMRAEVERRAGDAATVVEEPAQRPSSEAALALALLRPAPRARR